LRTSPATKDAASPVTEGGGSGMIVAWIPNERGLTRQELGNDPIPANAVWLDVINMTAEEETRIEAAVGIDMPNRATMQEIEASSRLSRDGQVVRMAASMLLKTETEAPEATTVTFILTKTLLVTLRYDEPWSFRVFSQRACKAGFITSEQIFAGILDTTIERLADLLELVSLELEHLSQRIFRKNARTGEIDLQRMLYNIGRCGNIAGKVRESLLDKQRVISFAEQSAHEWLTAEGISRLHALTRDLQSLTDHAAFTAGKINFLLDASLGLINNNVNYQMKIMNALMIAALWPALVSGFFSMNVQLPFPQQEHMWPFFMCITLAFGPLVVGAFWWWRRTRKSRRH
jgi:magnesium transporter